MKYLAMLIIFTQTLLSQTIQVRLDSLSTLDDVLVSLKLLTDNPTEKLILPEGIDSAKFLNLFYSWDTTDDEKISVAILQTDSSDILYADLNNDEDLANDGDPLIFKLSENSICLDIVGQNDTNQITRLKLSRKPDFPDSINSSWIDEQGNLLPRIAKPYGMVNNQFEFAGLKRTFFFDDRVTLRCGRIMLNGKTMRLGLFDYTNNGLFNDERDLVLIDLNNDGKLDYSHDEEIFKLNDIIRLADNNFILTDVDKYGLSFTLQETSQSATKYFSREEYDPKTDNTKLVLDGDFWNNIFTDTDGKKIPINRFKGKYLLLNFWGEWCMPCRDEVPHLVNSSVKFSSRMNIVSFLKTNNPDKARDFISSSGINWPQIELPEDIEKKFKILGYPTNILIFPDGKNFIRTGVINPEFFEKYIN